MPETLSHFITGINVKAPPPPLPALGLHSSQASMKLQSGKESKLSKSSTVPLLPKLVETPPTCLLLPPSFPRIHCSFSSPFTEGATGRHQGGGGSCERCLVWGTGTGDKCIPLFALPAALPAEPVVMGPILLPPGWAQRGCGHLHIQHFAVLMSSDNELSNRKNLG